MTTRRQFLLGAAALPALAVAASVPLVQGGEVIQHSLAGGNLAVLRPGGIVALGRVFAVEVVPLAGQRFRECASHV